MILKNVIVNGRRTSMRLEKEVWNALSESCKQRNISLNTLCSQVEKSKDNTGLSSAMRIHALNFYRELVKIYRQQTKNTKSF
ncbi:MAG: ribbon-helix-helix domain-containing protein [Alphaproteobacteria bacterium]|nr:ribbon-helix-helix domain-containing protein [Alphaproteobacteria bacterium]